MAVMVLLTAANFLCNVFMVRVPGRKRGLASVAVVFNLATLGLFKYFDFLLGTVAGALSEIGISVVNPQYQILLPLGISFYIFQCLTFTIDNYRGHISEMPTYVDFSLYIAFFPKLVAGPIIRPAEFFPQLKGLRQFSSDNAYLGAQLIILGLFKKLVLASFFEKRANGYFAMPDTLGALQVLDAGACYGMQIYYDFSGYTDIAIGSARILGFVLPGNFRSPYAARTFSDFWRRWHITLSEWFRDYMYFPLGGSRLGRWRTKFNLVATMLMVGLWHGPSWNFVAWGGVHGAYLSTGHELKGKQSVNDEHGTIKAILRVLLIFLLVSLAWILFRSPNIEAAALMLGRLVTGASNHVNAKDCFDLLLVIALGPLVQHFRLFQKVVSLTQRHIALEVGLYVALLALTVLAGRETQEFIYSRF